MLNDDTPTTPLVSGSASGACVCGTVGCDGSCVVQQEADTSAVVPVFSMDGAICTCAQYDPIAAAYQASLSGDGDAVLATDPDTQTNAQDPVYAQGTVINESPEGIITYLLQVEPIPDLPNPNPDGYTITTSTMVDYRTNFIPDTGNSIIDSLVYGYGWAGDTIAFSFNVQDIDGNGIADFDEGGWREFYTGMLANVTEYTGVDFWERPEGEGVLEFGLYPGAGGFAYFPHPVSSAIIVTSNVGINDSPEEAGQLITNYNFTHAWFHETAHFLGIQHPHEYNGIDGMDSGIGSGDAAVAMPGDNWLNSKFYSSTNYAGNRWGEDNPFTTAVDFGRIMDGLDQSTYLPMDIAAFQTIYGINDQNHLGDNLYTFNDSGLESRGLRTIWDNGGTDTIQYTGSTRSVINLNDATLQQEIGGGGFLTTSEAFDAGFFIANGVTVENAIGGNQQDFITGNEVANILTGNGGADVIKGGDGNDTIFGGDGNDKRRCRQ